MERRSFLKFLAASPLVSATTKEKIASGEKKPEFTKVELVECDSGTWPRRMGESFWVYFIPRSEWAICENGRHVRKTYLREIK